MSDRSNSGSGSLTLFDLPSLPLELILQRLHSHRELCSLAIASRASHDLCQRCQTSAWRRLLRQRFLRGEELAQLPGCEAAIVRCGPDWRARYIRLHGYYAAWQRLYHSMLARLPGPLESRVNLLNPEAAQLLVLGVAEPLLGRDHDDRRDAFHLLQLALNCLATDRVLDDNSVGALYIMDQLTCYLHRLRAINRVIAIHLGLAGDLSTLQAACLLSSFAQGRPLERVTETVHLRLDEIAQACLDAARCSPGLAVKLAGFQLASTGATAAEEEAPHDVSLDASPWDPETSVSLARLILDVLSGKYNFRHQLQLDEFDANSYIDRVLFNGVGLPIVKVAIFCGLASRFRLAVRPVNVPDHFMCRLLLDPNENPLERSVLVDAANGTLNILTNSRRLESFGVHRQHTGRMTLRRMALNLLIGVPEDQRDFLARQRPRGLDHNELHALLVALFPNEAGAQNLETHTANLTHPSLGQSQLVSIDYAYIAQLRRFCELTAIAASSSSSSSAAAAEASAATGASTPDAAIAAAAAAALPSYEASLARISAACSDAAANAIVRQRPPSATSTAAGGEASSLSAAAAAPLFPIGAVFRHRRYGYTAVVRGWDPRCLAAELWIQRMGVDRLQRGRGQPFYRALVEDGSERYVAEENIDLMSDAPLHRFPPVWHPEVGKYFACRHPLGCAYEPHVDLTARYPQDSQLRREIVERVARSSVAVATDQF